MDKQVYRYSWVVISENAHNVVSINVNNLQTYANPTEIDLANRGQGWVCGEQLNVRIKKPVRRHYQVVETALKSTTRGCMRNLHRAAGLAACKHGCRNASNMGRNSSGYWVALGSYPSLKPRGLGQLLPHRINQISVAESLATHVTAEFSPRPMP